MDKKIREFIEKFNAENKDDWNPENVNLHKMLTEYVKLHQVFGHCPCCGEDSVIEMKFNEESVICSNCGTDFYLDIKMIELSE